VRWLSEDGYASSHDSIGHSAAPGLMQINASL
jgi:hypothetical protein